MKRSKKFLSVILSAAIMTCSTSVSMKVSADASWAYPEEHVAFYVWTNYLEENGIPFSSMGDGKGDSDILYNMLKEKGISAASFCESNIPGVDNLIKQMKLLGSDDEYINWHFVCHMLGMQACIKKPFGTEYNAICWVPDYCVWKDEIPDNSEHIHEMLEQGYTWNPDFGWEFDVEEYMLMHDYYPSGRYSFTTNVSSNLALSDNKLTCQSNITGNNKTTKITVTQYLEMRSGKKWSVVRAWSKTASAKNQVVKNQFRVISGSYRLRTVFNVWAGKEHETITKYSGIKAVTSSAFDRGRTCDDTHFDINGDGFFSMDDIVTLQNALSTGAAAPEMDLNNDGKINVFDLVLIKRMISDSTDPEADA